MTRQFGARGSVEVPVFRLASNAKDKLCFIFVIIIIIIIISSSGSCVLSIVE